MQVKGLHIMANTGSYFHRINTPLGYYYIVVNTHQKIDFFFLLSIFLQNLSISRCTIVFMKSP